MSRLLPLAWGFKAGKERRDAKSGGDVEKARAMVFLTCWSMLNIKYHGGDRVGKIGSSRKVRVNFVTFNARIVDFVNGGGFDDGEKPVS